VVVGTSWDETTSIADVRADEARFRDKQVSVLEKIAGAYAGSYSNEADLLERDFQHVFYGPNYARLTEIKLKYDPSDLFIVGAGVGSERWDRYGLCRV
jgi:FAD/FMN-containing dehydrogenase